MSEAAARVFPADSPPASDVTTVNTLLARLVGPPAGQPVEQGLAALAEAGIPARLHRDPGAAPPGALPLVAAGRELGRLELPPDVEAGTAGALAHAFALALALEAAEATQRRERARRKAVLDGIGEGAWLREAGRIETNRAAREILGVDRDTPAEPDDFDLLDESGRRLPDEEYPSARALREGRPIPFTLHVARRDGERRLVEGVARPLYDAGGDVFAALSLFSDITEDGLSDRLLAALFDALPSAVTVSEPDSERLLQVNGAFLELVGRGEDEVVGTAPPFDWWASPPAQPVGEWSGVTAWEQLFRRPDGAVVHVSGRRFPLLGPNGETQRIVNVLTDLTDQHRFEQQLMQSGKLAAIGELAAGVAHEINNPLFAILGLVEFLLKEVEPGTKAHDRLTLIQQTGLEIKDIVRALLDFARERSDELALVSLEEVAVQTLDLVRRTTSAKAVTIDFEPAAEATPVNASANQLKQVILNLLTNAQHAMPDGGTVTVAVRRDGDAAVLSVTDTGPGIPAEVLDRIFDPFFTTKRDLGGTGLGLSVSLGIARMHGGELTAASEPGHGASFTLRLPLAPGEA